MAHTFTVTSFVRAPIETIFDLSLDIEAHIASVPGSQERAIAGVTTGRIGLGETVTWRARHFGIWWRMTSRITELDRPDRFVDEQVSGPFSTFRHEHVFTEVEGGTEVVEHVRWVAPLGILGRPVEQFVVGPYLQRLIERRALLLAQFAEERVFSDGADEERLPSQDG